MAELSNQVEDGNTSSSRKDPDNQENENNLIDDELDFETDIEQVPAKPVIIYLSEEKSRNKRRFKVLSNIRFDDLCVSICAKLKIEKIVTLVCDNEDLLILDDEDTVYLMERALTEPTTLRINYSTDIDVELKPMSPAKRKALLGGRPDESLVRESGLGAEVSGVSGIAHSLRALNLPRSKENESKNDDEDGRPSNIANLRNLDVARNRTNSLLLNDENEQECNEEVDDEYGQERKEEIDDEPVRRENYGQRRELFEVGDARREFNYHQQPTGFNEVPLGAPEFEYQRPLNLQRPVQNSSIMASSSHYTDNFMYKKALQFADDLCFDGKNSKMNIYLFKRRLLFHIKIHELRSKDVYKSLMNGSLVKGDALEMLQLNIMEINPVFDQSADDAVLGELEYGEMVKRIWKLLIMHYGDRDKVVEYTERLKAFKQAAGMSTMNYLAKFKMYRNELELEIEIRNEEKQIHLKLTTYQYAQILVANLRAEVMEYVLREAFKGGDDQQQIEQIDLDTVLKLAGDYSRIEKLRQNALSYTQRSNRRQNVMQVVEVRTTQAQNDDDRAINQVRASTNTRYCFSGKKSRCRKPQCQFTHFPESADDRVVRMYLARFADKDCRRVDTCSNAICPFKHSAARRRNLGNCRFDGHCSRNRCIFWHQKQVELNLDDPKRVNLVEKKDQERDPESKGGHKSPDQAILAIDCSDIDGSILRVEKVHEDEMQKQFVVDTKDPSLEDLEYSVPRTDQLDKLPRIVKAYFVYGTKYRLCGVIDSGADCTVAGKRIFDQFPEYIVANKLKAVTLVPAGAAMRYKSNVRLLLPVEYQDFDLSAQKWVTKKRTLEIWKFDDLPADLILVGRDSMKLLGLNVYDRAALKYALYTKLRDIGCNTLVDNEESNALFDRMQYKGGLQTGVYLVDERTNKVQGLEDFESVNDLKIVRKQAPDIEKNEFDVHYIRNHGATEIDVFQLEFDRLRPRALTEHDETDPDIYNDIIRTLRNNDRLIRDPAALFAKIRFGDDLGAELVAKAKQEIVSKNLLEVFTAYDWDLSVVECADFVLKIKDPANCQILEPYDLSVSDTILLNNELDLWLKSKSMHMLKQDEVMLHASPAFVVHRYLGHTPEGKRILKTRAAVDFVKLNANTHRYVNEYDKTIEELQLKLSGYAYFNRSDISKYFYCIPVAEESKKYGGIVWYDKDKRKKYGIMDCVMHGLMDAPIYGQEITARAFEGTDCITVQDDIFGGAKTREQAVRAFIRMLEIAATNKFRLNPGKTECGMKEIEAVGYTVKGAGMYPMPRSCTKALCYDTKLVGDFKALRSWCGALNFLNGYVPNLAQKTKRLKTIIFDEKDFNAVSNLSADSELKSALRESIKPKFNAEAKEIVEEINDYISAIPMLHHIDRSQTAGPLLLKVDTSLYGVGASLWQRRGNLLVLCRLFSKALTATESRYSATEREAVGFVKATERFHKILVRPHFFVIVDHKALLQLFGIDARRTKNYKLVRMRWRLAEYQFTMIHINGNSLGIAIEDFLSRYSKEATIAAKVKTDGIKVPLSVLEEKKDENEINLVEAARVELLEMHGYKCSDLAAFDEAIEDEVGLQTVALIQAQVDQADCECLYLKEGEKLTEYSMASPVVMAREFADSCDYTNILKNVRLRNPMDNNPNLLSYREINEISRELQISEIAEILLLQQVAAQNDRISVPPVGLANVEDFHREIGEIMMVETRAKRRLRESAEYQRKLRAMEFKPRRKYLFDSTENIVGFVDGVNPLRILYDTQRREYQAICLYLLTSDERELDSVSLNEYEYVELARKGEIGVNEEGILTKSGRYLVPSKLRVPIMHYYHNTITKQHRGEKVMISTFKERFFWIGMNHDIKRYVAQCPCKAAKMAKKSEAGFADKGQLTVYYATEPNQITFLDLYGPLPDGNYVASMIDGFDSYLVSTALRPVYDYTALGVIKFIMFEWLWIYGIPEKIVTDNGSNLVARLNRLFAMIFGIKTVRIFEYSPWVNGKVENTMKNINQAVYIEKARREIIGLTQIRRNIAAAVESVDYPLLVRTAALVNNNTIKESTGYEPRKLRFLTGSNILMDIQLKLSALPPLLKDKYVLKGVVDYHKFFKLLTEHRRFIEKRSKLSKLAKLNETAKLRAEQGIKSETFVVGDYVVYKAPYKSKKDPNIKYGWVIVDRKKVGDKVQYSIRNIFNGMIIRTNQGHIARFHKPMIKPTQLYTNELTRLFDMD